MPHLLISELTPGQRQAEKALLRAVGRPLQGLAYIPTKTEKDRKAFAQVAQQFKGMLAEEAIYCDLDKEFDEELFAKALATDIIFLAGGDPQSLLASIQEYGFIPDLQEFAERGGIFVGESAGAMVMGRDIDIALEGQSMDDSTGIGLYDFEFFPHFSGDAKELAKLKARSLKRRQVIVACPDGSGVVLQDDQVAQAAGKVTLIKGNDSLVFSDSIIKF